MAGEKKRAPNEVVTERIIQEIATHKTLLNAKRLNALEEYLASGRLSASEAESLFEFDRKAEVVKE